jgi:CBS domain-containing protein
VKVQEIMSREPRVCSPETNLCAAAALMLQGDCGFLPVVQAARLVGVVTDRDLYIALATRNRLASQLTVADVLQTPVHTCSADDDIRTALATMKEHRVRRLPVEGSGGTVIGVISLNDIALAAGARKPVSYAEVANTLRVICAHPVPRLVAV